MMNDVSAYDSLAPKYITLFEHPGESGEIELGRHREGGTLIIDSRDWESLIDDDPDYWALEARENGGGLTVPLYDWRLHGLGEPASLNLVWVSIALDNSTTVDSYEFAFTPFHREQLLRIVRDAGLIGSVIKFDSGNYWIVARR